MMMAQRYYIFILALWMVLGALPLVRHAEAGGEVRTAWATLAQARQLAAKWQADAELIEASATKAREDGSAGADSLLGDVAWWYRFYSPSYSPKVKKLYRVVSGPGKIRGFESPTPAFHRINGHMAVPGDAMDSDQAMKLLRKHGFKPMQVNAMTLSYPEFFSNKKPVRAYWCVTNEKIGYGGLCVDARTGEYVGGPLKSRKAK